MFGKAITYKTTTKCLVDNRTAKYEASVGPVENLPPAVQWISKTLITLTIVFTALLWQCWQLCLQHYFDNVDNCIYSITLTIVFTALLWQCWQFCLQHYFDNCVYSITLTILFTALLRQFCLQHYFDNCVSALLS